MCELSMNEVTTFRWSLEEDLENYRQAGYRSIGVSRHKLTDMEAERAVDLIAGSGLRVSNLSCAGGFTGIGGGTLREGFDDAAEALRLAAAMQAGCLVIHPGGRNNHISRHALRLLRTALDELLPMAEDCEVPLAIEPMHAACAAEWTFLTDMETVLDLLAEYRCESLKLAYDTYHSPWERPNRSLLGEIAGHVGIVYLADRRRPPNIDQDRCPLGQGELPLGEIVATLVENGYTGPFDVRLMGPEIVARDYWTWLRQSQSAFADWVPASPSHSSA